MNQSKKAIKANGRSDFRADSSGIHKYRHYVQGSRRNLSQELPFVQPWNKVILYILARFGSSLSVANASGSSHRVADHMFLSDASRIGH